MTGRKNVIIAATAIVIFAALVGFFITLDISPQIAYARLFIDVGLAIGIIAVVLAFYREKPLPVDSLIHAINGLKAGKYKTRISIGENCPLEKIAHAINELAENLALEQKRQEEIKRDLREELLPAAKRKEILTHEHSHHPELGPVLSVAKDFELSNHKALFELPRPLEINRQPMAILNNTLIDSKPPKDELCPIAPSIEIQDQDLGELFQKFVDAQREKELEQIDYQHFLKAIENARSELFSNHKCQRIIFDVVKEEHQVALQPRIIR